MKNQENKKQLWHTPEIIDLDVNKTKGGYITSKIESYSGTISS
jgi:hypothetical protein